MSTRFNPGSKSNYDQSPLPTGYENKSGTPDLFIPPCGIEDVDVALFNLFDKEIAPHSGGSDSDLKKVPIIFAAGEKWAMLKNGRPLRDRNNSLIIPLITIMRKEVSQDPSSDIIGRGMNQQVGEIVVRRKLDKSDRDYQNLINKIFLDKQDSTARPVTETTSTRQLQTARKLGGLLTDADISNGALLKASLLDNVYETIVVPTPQFYTAKYEVTVWTQYMQHSNQILERIVTSFLPQGQSWKLTTDKGYWFVASVEGGAFNMETNFDDMSQQERFLKHTFSISVPAYFFANRSPGNPIPVKRYVSSPIIQFESSADSPAEGDDPAANPYVLGSDDPTLPLDLEKNSRTDQRTPGFRMQKITDTPDPAVDGLPRGRVVTKLPNGETVYSGGSFGPLKIIKKSRISSV